MSIPIQLSFSIKMKKNSVTIAVLVGSLCYLQACNKSEELQPTTAGTSITAEIIDQHQTVFAKALSQALQADPELRAFLKKESLTQFDRDADILYQMVKDKPLGNGGTVHDRLARYLDKVQLAEIEETLPLLTIFVPSLPNGFAPNTWQTEQEIPVVAVRHVHDNKVPLYDAEGNEDNLPAGSIPGFPVLVVKQNERVIVGVGESIDKQAKGRQFFQNQRFNYRFAVANFDGQTVEQIENTKGSLAKTASRAPIGGGASNSTTNRTAYSSYSQPIRQSISLRNAQAYDIGVANPNYEWQRDYVYYGITPTSPRGPLKTTFQENIRAFRLSNSGIQRISGYGDDPLAIAVGNDNTNSTAWSDGNFEFLISVLTNPKDGSTPQQSYRFGATPNDLYDYTTERRTRTGPFGLNYRTYYVVTSVTPKEFYPNIGMSTWDLSNFGTAWTYHIFEENQTKTYTNQESVSTTYAANFEFDPTFAGFVKGGAKFGASASTTNTKTVTVTYTEGSTDLGERISYFYDSIILSSEPRCCGFLPIFTTYDLAPGGSAGYVFLSVEPFSVVQTENE